MAPAPRVAWLVVLALLAGCESAAPAADRAPSSARAPATFTDWGGHVDPPGAPRPLPPVPRDTWILHIGDSFVYASLQQNLAARVRASGATYIVYALQSTYTTTWAYDPVLDDWLSRRPALVLVTLGANEVDISKPEQHAGAIETLARKIARVHAGCVWITPPMWKPDTGILQVIHDHDAPCLYFDSDAVLGGKGLTRAERKPDGIHPNEKGGKHWADALWPWLMEHRDPDRPAWGLEPFETRR